MFLQTIPDTVLALDAAERGGPVAASVQADRSVEPEDGPRAARRPGVRADLGPARDGAGRAGPASWSGTTRLRPAVRPPARSRYQLRSAPLVVGDKVIQGVTASFAPAADSSSALDIDSGEGALAIQHDRAARTSPAATAGTDCRWIGAAADRSGTRAPTMPELNLIYFGVAPTYDTGPLLHPVGRRRRHRGCALHELHDRAESRHRKAGLALPARRERPVGPRLGVRAPDRRR